MRSALGVLDLASFTAELARVVVRAAGLRKKYAREHVLFCHATRGRTIGPTRPSKAMHRKFDISLETRHGHEVYTSRPMKPRAGIASKEPAGALSIEF
jgi:hypothetical protein